MTSPQNVRRSANPSPQTVAEGRFFSTTMKNSTPQSITHLRPQVDGNARWCSMQPARSITVAWISIEWVASYQYYDAYHGLFRLHAVGSLLSLTYARSQAPPALLLASARPNWASLFMRSSLSHDSVIFGTR